MLSMPRRVHEVPGPRAFLFAILLLTQVRAWGRRVVIGLRQIVYCQEAAAFGPLILCLRRVCVARFDSNHAVPLRRGDESGADVPH